MLADRLHQWFAPPQAEKADTQTVFWFTLSLVFSLIFSWIALQQAISGDYIVQDDARQHVFWMQRFIDPDLFPNDRIADYFQAVSPWGYRHLYQVFAGLWISPWTLNKALPMILGLITTGYAYGLCLRLIPLPFTGFLATLLLNQSLWMKDDLVTGTPRAFVYALLLAMLYYLVGRSLIPCTLSLMFMGLFYPPILLIAVGMLLIQPLTWDGDRWQQWQTERTWANFPIRFVVPRRDVWFYGVTIGMAILSLILCAAASSGYEPVVTASGSRNWIEMSPEGRTPFFSDNPAWFFLLAPRSGLLNVGLVRPATLVLAIFLPLMLKFPKTFPRSQDLTPHLRILPQLLVVSVVWFCVAHFMLFKLHVPSRYTEHTFRVVCAFAAAIVLTLLLDWIFKFATHLSQTHPQGTRLSRLTTGATVLVFGILVLGYPLWIHDFFDLRYKQGTVPELYAFLSQQPKDTLVASLSEEADNIPSFAQRSVLVAREYALPYHWGYYEEFRDRVNALIQAQYSSDPAIVQSFIETYGVTHWLLDRPAFNPNYLRQGWFNQYQPKTNEAIQFLRTGEQTAFIETHEQDCSVFRIAEVNVLGADCLLNAIQSPANPTPPAETDETSSETENTGDSSDSQE